MDLKKEMGSRIRARREACGYTRDALEDRSGVSVRFIAAVEAGEKGLSCEYLYLICNALHTSADFILFGREEAQCRYLLDGMNESQKKIAMEVIESLTKLTKA